MSTCKSCQAETKWAKFSDSGRFVMLDPEPVPGGNLAMKAGANYADGIPRVWVLSREDLKAQAVQISLLSPGGADDRALGWRAHFSTCPNADHHRRNA